MNAKTIAVAGLMGVCLSVHAMAAVDAPQAAALAAKPAATKAGSARTANFSIPRLRNGKPDFNGVWHVANSANYNIEPHASSAALQMRPGPVVPVPVKEVVALGAVGSVPAGLGVVEGGLIPYTPAALKQRDANKADWIHKDPEIKCDLPGVPRANYMALPFQILESDKSMMFVYEYDGAVRHLLFKDPGPPPIDSWMGQSVAHWEGDTLAVVVTGLNDSAWFDRAGNFHTADMKVVEKYHYTGPGVVRYEAEITDQAIFTRPWKLSMNLYKSNGEDAHLQQFRCVDFVEELMYGHLRKEPLK
jgi:hypothetical protein